MGDTTSPAEISEPAVALPPTGCPQDCPVPATDTHPPMKLILKLGEAMAALHRIPKNGWNDFHKYQYAMEADVVEAVREELAKRHVMLIPQIDGWSTDVGEKGERFTTVQMTFTFLDGESGETMSKPWLGQASDKSDKGLWKAITGATKYFIMKSFLLPTGDDPENDSGTALPPSNSAVGAPSPVGKSPLRMAKSETPQPEPVSTIASQLRASLEAAGLPVSNVSTDVVGQDGYSPITQLRSDEWGWCHVTLGNGQSAKTKVKRNIDKLRTAESARLPVKLGLTVGGLIDVVDLAEQPF